MIQWHPVSETPDLKKYKGGILGVTNTDGGGWVRLWYDSVIEEWIGQRGICLWDCTAWCYGSDLVADALAETSPETGPQPHEIPERIQAKVRETLEERGIYKRGNQ